ncbi:MAG TPA: hypothetical protein VH309_08925, partial [Elusimicrobiota bacterium]|nr:hypothetical protein [Elusimicrobiota bacterium]
MDSFQLWKDEYRREVEDVLAERRRAREKGERPDTAPGESVASRLADLVIPPAGVHAEAAALRSRLAEAEALNADLRRLAAQAEEAAVRERGRRERIKDAAARLAVDLRGLQGELLVAREQAKLSIERVADAERGARERAGIDEARAREARLDADHAAARAEDAERASTARLQSARELHARFDALQIESEAKGAELAALRTRLETTLERASQAEARGAEIERRLHAELAALRAGLASAHSAVEEHSLEGADLEKRARENWAAARSAADEAARARAEARAESVRRETLEAALQQEALRTATAERAADEAREEAKAAA